MHLQKGTEKLKHITNVVHGFSSHNFIRKSFPGRVRENLAGTGQERKGILLHPAYMTWEKNPEIVLSWIFWAEHTNTGPEMSFRPLSTLATSPLILQPRPWCFKERNIPESKLGSKGGNLLLPIAEPLGLGKVTINKVQTNHNQGSNWGVHTEALHVTWDARRYLAWPPAAAEEAVNLCRAGVTPAVL